MQLDLRVLPDLLSICRLAPGTYLPADTLTGALWSVTSTTDELSLVCAREALPADAAAGPDWRAVRVAGTLDFGLTGILSSLATPLAEAEVPIFAVSTFDTDYVLVPDRLLEVAVRALGSAGHRISELADPTAP